MAPLGGRGPLPVLAAACALQCPSGRLRGPAVAQRVPSLTRCLFPDQLPQAPDPESSTEVCAPLPAPCPRAVSAGAPLLS